MSLDITDSLKGAADSMKSYYSRLQPVWMDKVGLEAPGIISPETINPRLRQLQSGSIYNRPVANPYTNPATLPGAQPNEAMTASVFAAKYGYAAAFLDHPEVGPILRKAAASGWGEAELYGAITQTGWWKASSDNARSWEMLVNEDPATASRIAAEAAAAIQNKARTLGIPMSRDQITHLARTAAQHGWTEDQVLDRLVGQVNWAGLEGGDLTHARDRVKAIAGDFLVNVSDATAQNYAARIASGEMSEDGVKSIMQKQAKARFSWMADEIDQGISPSMYLDPIRMTIAQELEMAPEAVNLMDGKWMGMIEVPDDKTGQLRAATVREAQLSARKDARWADTSNAQSAVARTVQFVQQAMGRRSL